MWSAEGQNAKESEEWGCGPVSHVPRRERFMWRWMLGDSDDVFLQYSRLDKRTISNMAAALCGVY